MYDIRRLISRYFYKNIYYEKQNNITCCHGNAPVCL